MTVTKGDRDTFEFFLIGVTTLAEILIVLRMLV